MRLLSKDVKFKNLGLFIIDEEQLERIRCYRCELGYETAALDSNIALAIYTSGSTGFPKGVLQERGVLREAQKKFSDETQELFAEILGAMWW